MHKKSGHRNRLIHLSSPLIVLVLSLLLLFYVGFGEAYRTYAVFYFDGIAALGEVVQLSMETFVKAGHPLKQYVGFNTLTKPMLDTEKSIIEVNVTDANGEIVFLNRQVDSKNYVSGQGSGGAMQASAAPKQEKNYQLLEKDAFCQLTMPLKNKFEKVGNLNITMPANVISREINHRFFPVLIFLICLLMAYIAFLYTAEKRWLGKWKLWINVTYSISFIIMTIVIVFTLTNIYSTGIKGKTKALADLLTQRLNAAIELGLELDSFSELDETFAEYKELNSDISFIALTDKSKVILHTNPQMIGKQLHTDTKHFAYYMKLHNPNQPGMALSVGVNVGVLKKIVYQKLWRSIKNFFVLFVACSFLAALFLNLMLAFREKKELDEESEADKKKAKSAHIKEGYRLFNLELIEPPDFLVIFLEGLIISFLPHYVEKIAHHAHLGAGSTSAFFTVYFAVFALTLVPAGWYVDRHGVKKVLVEGYTVLMVGMLLLAFLHNFYLLMLVRALTAVGQGMLAIAIHAYILRTVPENQKTQGSSKVVYGHSAGMIAGTALGALLVNYIGESGVFVVSSIIALSMAVYIAALLPEPAYARKTEMVSVVNGYSGRFKRVFRSLYAALKDREFLKTSLLIGVTTNAVVAGVTSFTLPLLLSHKHFASEDIGQILMLYSAGVLIASGYSAKLADKMGKTRSLLIIGMHGSAVGLILTGLMGWGKLAHGSSLFWPMVALITGISLVGLAHGFIQAPVVTHIIKTKAAVVFGESSTLSFYRLLEYLGGAAAPVVFAQLLHWGHESMMVISGVGVLVIICGLLFTINLGRGKDINFDQAARSGN